MLGAIAAGRRRSAVAAVPTALSFAPTVTGDSTDAWAIYGTGYLITATESFTATRLHVLGPGVGHATAVRLNLYSAAGGTVNGATLLGSVDLPGGFTDGQQERSGLLATPVSIVAGQKYVIAIQAAANNTKVSWWGNGTTNTERAWNDNYGDGAVSPIAGEFGNSASPPRVWASNKTTVETAYPSGTYVVPSWASSDATISVLGGWSKVLDSSGTTWQAASPNAGITVDGSTAYTVLFRIKKDTVGKATRYPMVRLGGGMFATTIEFMIDTNTGDYIVSGSGYTAHGRKDEGDHWLFWLQGTSLSFSAGATWNAADITFWPAVGAGALGSGTWAASLTGSASIRDFGVYKGTFTP